MLTTTVAGRTWNFSHAIGRNSAAGAGFTQPTAVAVAPDGILYVLSRGQEGPGGVVADNKRIGKVSMDQEFIRDFARREFIRPASPCPETESCTAPTSTATTLPTTAPKASASGSGESPARMRGR